MKRIFSILAIALTMFMSLTFGQPALAEVSPGAKSLIIIVPHAMQVVKTA